METMREKEMETKMENWMVDRIVRNSKKPNNSKDKLYFDMASQRESGLWNTKMKSDLIHSLLAGYAIPPIYVVKYPIAEDGNVIRPFSVIDGQQRLTSTVRYVSNTFALSKETDPVERWVDEVDDDGYYKLDENGNRIKKHEVIEIAGKKFSELPSEMQDKLLESTFPFVTFMYISEKEAKIQMARLNAGKKFTSVERTKVLLGESSASEIKKASELPIFEKVDEAMADKVKADSVNESLFKSIALYSNGTNGDFHSMSGARLEKAIAENDDWKPTISKIREILTEINNFLPEDFVMSKMFIKHQLPILVFNYDTFECKRDDGEMTTEQYSDFIKYFVTEVYNDKYVEEYLVSANDKKKVMARVELMDNLLDEFINSESETKLETVEETEREIVEDTETESENKSERTLEDLIYNVKMPPNFDSTEIDKLAESAEKALNESKPKDEKRTEMQNEIKALWEASLFDEEEDEEPPVSETEEETEMELEDFLSIDYNSPFDEDITEDDFDYADYE